jgi:hypothetical protein
MTHPHSRSRQGCTREVGQATSCTKVANAVVTKASAPVKSSELSLKLLVMVISLGGMCTQPGVKVRAYAGMPLYQLRASWVVTWLGWLGHEVS